MAVSQCSQPLELAYSHDAAESLPVETQVYPNLRIIETSKPQTHSNTPKYNSSFDPKYLQTDQPAVSLYNFQGMTSVMTDLNRCEASRYSILAPQVRPKGSVGSLSSSYKAVALMSKTSVVAPMSLGMATTFTIPSRGSGDLAIEHTLTDTESFETHLAQAQNHAAYGLTALAEDQYMAAIAKCLKSRKEVEVRECLQEINMFFKQDRTPEELKYSLITCRNLLYLLEQEPSSTIGIRSSGTVMLADLLARDGQLQAAKTMYMRALSLTYSTDDIDIHQKCQSSLGKVLYSLWSSNEDPVREQLRRFSNLLDQNFCKPTLRSALLAMSTVANLFSSIESFHPCYDLSLVVDQLCNILAKQITGCSSIFELRLRRLTMKLALACSELRWDENADTLIRTQIEWLGRLATADWGYDIIRGYVDCCVHFKRQANFGKCIEMVKMAYLAMENLIYSRSTQSYRAADLSLLRQLKFARAGIPTGSCRQDLIQRIENMEARLERFIVWFPKPGSGPGGQSRWESGKEKSDSGDDRNGEEDDAESVENSGESSSEHSYEEIEEERQGET
jgi:hypothetical protein